MTTRESLIAETARGLLLDLDEDFVGIWQIFARLRRERDDWDGASITAAAEEVLARMVAEGAEFGNLDGRTGYFIPWPDQENAIERASREWQAMDRDPTIDEIAWLDLDDPARETRAPTEPSTATFDELVEETTQFMTRELKRSAIGPWLIFLYLWRVRTEASLEEIQDLADAVLVRLVAQGAVIGDYDPGAKTTVPWPDQEGAVQRVSQEWRALGRSPAAGEICWIRQPRP